MTQGCQQVAPLPARSLCQWRSLYIAQSKTPPGPLLQCCACLKLEDGKFQYISCFTCPLQASECVTCLWVLDSTKGGR